LIAEQFGRAFPDLEWRVDLLLSEGGLAAALDSVRYRFAALWLPGRAVITEAVFRVAIGPAY
jgi:hypothetical protein